MRARNSNAPPIEKNISSNKSIIENVHKKCKLKFGLSRKSLVNCGRHNKDSLVVLVGLEFELTSVRKKCQIETRNPFEQINSSTIHMSDSFNGNFTNCSLALNLTSKELEKCLSDQVKIRNQIEAVNKTLIDVKCRCKITCQNDDQQNKIVNQTTQLSNAQFQVPKTLLTSTTIQQGPTVKSQPNMKNQLANNSSNIVFEIRSLNLNVSKLETTTQRQQQQVTNQNFGTTTSPTQRNLTAPKVKSRITDETRSNDPGLVLSSSNNVIIPSAVMAEVFSSDEDEKSEFNQIAKPDEKYKFNQFAKSDKKLEFNQIANSFGKKQSKPIIEVFFRKKSFDFFYIGNI